MMTGCAKCLARCSQCLDVWYRLDFGKIWEFDIVWFKMMVCIGLLLPSKAQLLRKGTSGSKAYFIGSRNCWSAENQDSHGQSVFLSDLLISLIVRRCSMHFPYENMLLAMSVWCLDSSTVPGPGSTSKALFSWASAGTRQCRNNVEVKWLYMKFLDSKTMKIIKNLCRVTVLRFIIFCGRGSNSMTVLCKFCRSWAPRLHILFQIRTTNVSSQSAAQIIQVYHWRIDLLSWAAIEKHNGGRSMTHHDSLKFDVRKE